MTFPWSYYYLCMHLIKYIQLRHIEHVGNVFTNTLSTYQKVKMEISHTQL